MYKTLSRIGFTRSNTILADSSCADELNHDDTQQDITSLFRDRWGEVCRFFQAMPALSQHRLAIDWQCPSSGVELPQQQAAAVRSHDVRSDRVCLLFTGVPPGRPRRCAVHRQNRMGGVQQPRSRGAARVIMFCRAHQTTVNSKCVFKRTGCAFVQERGCAKSHHVS